MMRLLSLASLILLLAFPLAAQEDIDDLFNDPDSGLLEEGEPDSDEPGEAGEPGTDGEDSEGAEEAGAGDGAESSTGDSEPPAEEEGVVDLDALTTSPATFRGSVNAQAGVALGLEEWPGSEAAGDREFQDLRRTSGLYDMSANISVDARPQPYLRFYGKMSTDLNEDRMVFPDPSLDEIFVDYTLYNLIFFRAGKQGLTWGQGRLFKNHANLVDRVSGGVALRGSVPLWRGTLNAVTYSRSAWVQQYRQGHPDAFAYAGLYEATVGPVSFEVSSHYKKDELVGSAGSVTFGLGPVDLTFEGAGHWDNKEPADGFENYGLLSQIYWESEGGDWTALGEYEFDSEIRGGNGHYAGVAFQAPKFGGGGWRPRLRWLHAFEDDSGEVLPAVSGTVAPSLDASIGVPIVYGEPGSYFRALEDDETALPVEDVISVLLGIELSFSF